MPFYLWLCTWWLSVPLSHSLPRSHSLSLSLSLSLSFSRPLALLWAFSLCGYTATVSCISMSFFMIISIISPISFRPYRQCLFFYFHVSCLIYFVILLFSMNLILWKIDLVLAFSIFSFPPSISPSLSNLTLAVRLSSDVGSTCNQHTEMNSQP